jgi:tRNA-dihydrouridine synthase B
MAKAASIISETYKDTSAAFIDVNMGCPVHKIFSNGEGSALMKSPGRIELIVKAIKSAVSIPVTVKIRTGIDENSINAVDCALAAEAGGADALCIHGRTRKQMYAGSVDRKTIAKVKKSLHIPVIANGDINSAEDALSMLSDTGADGIAIGRGAVGNPFLFDEIRAALKGESYSPPTLSERIDTALLQLKIAVEDKGERVAVTEARKQIALYLKGFRGASSVRGEINKALTYMEVENIFLSLK